MPEILAGPNGAGKSAFAEQFQRDQEDIAYVNADQKAAELSRLYGSTTDTDVAAARLMLREVEMLIDARQDLMIETTLASLMLRAQNPRLEGGGLSCRPSIPSPRKCRVVHRQSGGAGRARKATASPKRPSAAGSPEACSTLPSTRTW